MNFCWGPRECKCHWCRKTTTYTGIYHRVRIVNATRKESGHPFRPCFKLWVAGTPYVLNIAFEGSDSTRGLTARREMPCQCGLQLHLAGAVR